MTVSVDADSKDAKFKSAAKALLTILKYGAPRIIQTDNGPQYTSEVVEELMKYFNIQYRYTLPYRPQANGIVERSTKEVMRHLRVIVFDGRVRKSWSTYLPFIQRIMMYSYHDSNRNVSSTSIIWRQSFSISRADYGME